MKSILTCVVIFCSLVKPVAEKWKVDPALILAVMWVESRCPVCDGKGAILPLEKWLNNEEGVMR